MPRGPQILSPQQVRDLEAARAAFLAHNVAEREAKAEYDAMMTRRMLPHRIAVARTVRDAIDHGVPKARVNLEALGVSTPNAWVRWADLAQAFETAGMDMPAATPNLPSAPLPPLYATADIPVRETLPAAPEWPLPAALGAHEHAHRLSFEGDPANRRINVAWAGYPSTAEDAPETLVGTVQYNPTKPGGWEAAHDPQDKDTLYGIETGALTFEVETRRGVSPLRAALNEFVEAAELPEFVAVGFDADLEDDGF